MTNLILKEFNQKLQLQDTITGELLEPSTTEFQRYRDYKANCQQGLTTFNPQLALQLYQTAIKAETDRLVAAKDQEIDRQYQIINKLIDNQRPKDYYYGLLIFFIGLTFILISGVALAPRFNNPPQYQRIHYGN